jgi:hypothetical protein
VDNRWKVLKNSEDDRPQKVNHGKDFDDRENDFVGFDELLQDFE